MRCHSSAMRPAALCTAIAMPVVLLYPASPALGQTQTPEDASLGTHSSTDSSTDASTDPLKAIAVGEQGDDTNAPALSRAQDRPLQIEEVIVTATKREQSIREIPASITAYSGEKLESSGKLGLNDFIQETPGVTAAQGAPGYTRLTFRGISTDTNPYAGNAQPVGIFIGDTPFTDPYIANIVPDLSAFDLADVEVLKGPQGTLFGGSALSGAVRYQLQEPVLREWQLRGFTQLAQPKGGSTAFTYGVAGNAPIGDDLAIRLNYVSREYSGTVDDLRHDKKNVDRSDGDGLRAQLLWQPGAWKLKLTHLAQDFSGDNLLQAVDSPRGPRETDRAVLAMPSKNEFALDSLEVSYDFDSVRLISLTSHVSRDAVFTSDATTSLIGTPPPGYPETAAVLSKVTNNSKSTSQEIRLQSTGGGDFNWLVGAYFFDYDGYFNILIDTPLNQSLLGPGSLLGSNPLLGALFGALGVPNLGSLTSLLDGTSDAKSQERALFADVSYDLLDGLTLSAGGRFYETEVKGGFVGSGLLITGNQNDGLGSNTVAKLDERGFNPKLSATYRFNRDFSIYAAAAKGFRFGGLQALPSTPTNGVPPTFKSDTLWNYEIGLRSDWLDRTLRADLTGFYIRYDNPIITQQTQGIPINYNTNVSAAISRGVEASLLWNTPIRGLTASLSGGYTDAHITESFTAANGDVVEPGARMPGSAKFQYSSSLQYLHVWDQFTLAPNLSYTYVGKGYSNITHDVEINDLGTLNAGLVLGAENMPGKPKLAFNMINLLDTTRPVAGSSGTVIVTRQEQTVYLLNPPRTLTVRLGLEF
ncbi:TonB-dependent receptor [Hydrocarboniphaga effusa]|uniref:TonB-dependent receptor n=1 Tax=Hydrocarboniphaga effusa TaxID=243629 RepID=UPI003137A795